MNDLHKTLTFVGAAALLAGAVFLTRPVQRSIGIISDQGELLAPLLTDPQAVTSLEVVSFDDTAAKVRAFKVAFDGKRWTIPSHSGYPADATDKVAAAASAFVDLKKERVISDSKGDHAQFGLLSPDDENASAAPGAIGTRVTMLDGNGKTLCNLIIGKGVGASPTTPFESAVNKKYVRDAGKNRVYATTLTSGFSTKFVDWVQTDLLKCTAEQMTAITIDRYRIDGNNVVDQQAINLQHPAYDPMNATADRKWTMDAKPGGGPGDGQIVSEAKVGEITAALTGLRIVGVRPKPANLAKLLGGERGAGLTLPDQLSLQQRGFVFSDKGALLATDGQLSIRNNDGVIYSMWIGEVVPEGEDAASGGRVGGETDKPGETKPADKKAGDSRYLLIRTGFDEKQLPEPVKPEGMDLPTPIMPQPEGEAGGQEGTDDPPEVAAAKQSYKQAMDDWKSKKESGKKRADDLAKRFAEWYYVIDGQSVTKLRPKREDLLIPDPAKAKPADPTVPVAPPGSPGEIPIPPPGKGQ